MSKKKTIAGILTITSMSILAMTIVDGVINPGYLYKSMIKLIMFLLIPLIYIRYDENIQIKDLFKLKRKGVLRWTIFLGIGVYIIILGAYLILKQFIDLSMIREILDNNLKVNKENFIWIALYISFINSMLEEFFFRGFIFLNLKKLARSKQAYIFSAFVFAIYHVAIMGDWFSPLIFLLAMAGLFVGGLIFNYLNESSSTIYGSWIVHMMANFAINTVGLIMFGTLQV